MRLEYYSIPRQIHRSHGIVDKYLQSTHRETGKNTNTKLIFHSPSLSDRLGRVRSKLGSCLGS